jgi:uncharacterized protein
MVHDPSVLSTIGASLWMALGMFWQMLWALILGFGISSAVQAVVSKGEVAKLLPDDSPKSLLKACGLGAASSSCSYAATAIARSLFRKGANFTSSIAFEFASTNLVIELGILLWVLLGWQFTVAEFIGGFIMVALLAVFFRMFLKMRAVDEAREQAIKGVAGVMEGHAAMDMSVKMHGSLWQRMTSSKGYTSISHYFIMDVVSLWKDIALGVVLSGFLAVLVPESGWKALFYSGHGFASSVLGAAIGPLVSFLSFVCSVGNVPLAAVLWKGGISFGGVIAFIFADLLIIPILNIYRKYYGWTMMLFLFATSYIAMAVAGLLVELLFSAVGLIPPRSIGSFAEAGIEWNYTTVLNILFLIPVIFLLIRFFRTGGIPMLKMMEMTEAEMQHHDHSHMDHSPTDQSHAEHSHSGHSSMGHVEAGQHSCCEPSKTTT